jgi:hypothetical protein
MRKTKTTKIPTRPIITGSPRVVLCQNGHPVVASSDQTRGLQNRFSNSTWGQKKLVIGERSGVIDRLWGRAGKWTSAEMWRSGRKPRRSQPSPLRSFSCSVFPQRIGELPMNSRIRFIRASASTSQTRRSVVVIHMAPRCGDLWYSVITMTIFGATGS